jgi:hypothetical protein
VHVLIMDGVRRWKLSFTSFTTSIVVGAVPEKIQLHAGWIVGILQSLGWPRMLEYTNKHPEICSFLPEWEGDVLKPSHWLLTVEVISTQYIQTPYSAVVIYFLLNSGHLSYTLLLDITWSSPCAEQNFVTGSLASIETTNVFQNAVCH